MSKVNITPHLFLGVEELSMLQEFLKESGHEKHRLDNTRSVGIARQHDFSDVLNTSLIARNFQPSEGSQALTVKIAEGYAMVRGGEIIYAPEQDDIAVPNDGNWHYMFLQYLETPTQLGTISITQNGQMSGVGTSFTKTLRGAPNFPSIIEFTNSNSNTEQYTVLNVATDTFAILQGNFVAESDLEFRVVGTYTPGQQPPTHFDYPFQFDSHLLTVEVGSGTGGETKPFTNPLTDILICRAKIENGVLIVEDIRNQWWKTKAQWEWYYIDRLSSHPCIGVESVQFDNNYSTKSENVVNIGWGFRSTNWTINSTQRKITLLNGNGGKYKTPADFVTGSFNGWRLYALDGTYQTIQASSKDQSSITLQMESLNPADYETGDELVIVPPIEEITIIANEDGNSSNSPSFRRRFTFPIREGVGKFKLVVPASDSYFYNIKYQYKLGNVYSQERVLPDNPIGFYDEASFDSNGLLLPIAEQTLVPYNGDDSDGYIELKAHPNSYFNLIESISLGDLPGVEEIELTNANPIIQLEVGVNKQYQIITTNNSALTLSGTIFINIKNTKAGSGQNVLDGSFFHFHLRNINVDLGNFELLLVENYVDPTNYDKIHSFTETDLSFAKGDTINNVDTFGLIVRATRAFGNWVLAWFNETSDILHEVADATTGLGTTLDGYWTADANNPLTFTRDRNTVRICGGLEAVTDAPLNALGSNLYLVTTLPAGYIPNRLKKSPVTFLDRIGGNAEFPGTMIVVGQTGSFGSFNPGDVLLASITGNPDESDSTDVDVDSCFFDINFDVR